MHPPPQKKIFKWLTVPLMLMKVNNETYVITNRAKKKWLVKFIYHLFIFFYLRVCKLWYLVRTCSYISMRLFSWKTVSATVSITWSTPTLVSIQEEDLRGVDLSEALYTADATPGFHSTVFVASFRVWCTT